MRDEAAVVAAVTDLSGKRMVVTGGYSGIGTETVRALAGAGADVIVGARRPALALSCSHIPSAPGESVHWSGPSRPCSKEALFMGNGWASSGVTAKVKGMRRVIAGQKLARIR